jgi:hypothetical protein
MRRAVLFGAYFFVCFALTHLFQWGVAVVPDWLQPRMTLGWAILSGFCALMMTAIQQKDRSNDAR